MLSLISREIYEETINLIDGIKSPDPVLKGMQEFYASYEIKLYNLYMRDIHGKNILTALTNVPEGYVHKKYILRNFSEDSLREYARLCDLYGVDYSLVDNFTQENKTLGTGFYFDRIWKVELVGQIGNDLASDIQEFLSKTGKAHKVVHSGLGAVTIFQDTLLSGEEKNTIETMARAAISRVDRWGICNKHKVIEYDTIERLNSSFGGSLKEYFM